jgi:catechol 2,3-dioxygenase-like lactoylglutathione lyase family enzyme
MRLLADGRTTARTERRALVPRDGRRPRISIVTITGPRQGYGMDPGLCQETMETGIPEDMSVPPRVEAISAVTLVTHDMARAVRFYRDLGFTVRHGGEQASFTSFHAGAGYLNLIARPDRQPRSWWGRVIFHVSDVDAFHARASAAGPKPDTRPADAPWGERFFHMTDPDGHELSFARPLADVGTPADGAPE